MIRQSLQKNRGRKVFCTGVFMKRMSQTLMALALCFVSMITLASDELLMYLPADAILVSHVDAEQISNSEFLKSAGYLNSVIAKSSESSYDFSENLADFSEMLLVANAAPESQLLFLKTTLTPEEFFKLMEKASESVMTRTTVNNRPAAIFPSRIVNRKLRGKIEPSVIYLTDSIVFVGDLKAGRTILENKLVKPANRAETFAFAPSEAFAVASLNPESVEEMANFLGGLQKVNVALENIDEGKGVKLFGELICVDEQTAEMLANNILTLAITVLPTIMRDDAALAIELVSQLKVTPEETTVKIIWELDGKACDKLVAYVEKTLEKESKSQKSRP